MRTRVKNTTKETMIIFVVTREQVELEPGEEIEIEGDIELTDKI